MYYIKSFIKNVLYSEDVNINVYNGVLIDFEYLKRITRTEYIKILIFYFHKCELTFKPIMKMYGERISKHIFKYKNMFIVVDDKFNIILEFTETYKLNFLESDLDDDIIDDIIDEIIQNILCY